MKKRLPAAMLAVVIILQLAVLCGCRAASRASSQSDTYGAATDASGGINDNSPSANGSTADAGSSSSALSTADSSKFTSSGTAATNAARSNSARKVIMSAQLNLQTKDYDKSTAGLESLVNQYGGFVQSSSTQGTGVNPTDDARTANYTVRIPSDKLNDFITSVGSVGKIVSKSVKGEDISKQYYDTKIQLDTLKAEHQRILDILSKTTNMTDVITIEQRLSDIETQINQITGEIQQWDSLVDLSTVTITINEVKQLPAAKDDFGGQLGNTLSGSLHALVSTFKVIVEVVVALLPFIIVFGGIALIIVLIVKRVGKRNKKRVQPPQTPEVQGIPPAPQTPPSDDKKQ